jgi:hypothetical protein
MVVALWTAIAGLMGSYAIAGPSPVFLAAAVERSLTRAMPGSIIAVVIATLGGLGQVLNFFVAVCLVVGGLATIAGVAMWLGGRLERDGDDEQPMPEADRRRVVGTAVVAVATSAVSYVLGASGVGRESPDAGDPVERVDAASDGEGESVASLRQTAAERSFDVSGLEPLVSTDFYEVDINAVNPDVSREAWSLSVTGAVENEFTPD